MRAFAIRLLGSLLFLGPFGACGGDSTGPGGGGEIPCADDAECPAGMICRDGFCAGMGGEADGGDRDGPPGGGDPDIEIDPDGTELDKKGRLNFGSPLLDTETPLTLTIANVGGSDLEINSITLLENDVDIASGEEEEFFLDENPSPAVVAPGDAVTLVVGLSTNDVDVDTGFVVISSNDPDEGQVEVTLFSEIKGDPILEVCALESVDDTDCKCEIDYGVVEWGDVVDRVVRLRNVGDGNQTIDVTDLGILGLNPLFDWEAFTLDGGVETPADLPFLLVPCGAGACDGPNETLWVRMTFTAEDLDSYLPGPDGLTIEMDPATPVSCDESGDPVTDATVPVVAEFADCGPNRWDVDDDMASNGCEYACTFVDSYDPCDGVDQDCDGDPDDDVDFSICGVGDCAEDATCTPAGVVVCGVAAPADTTCDGDDDDCNGETDEEWTAFTCGLGACAVTATCVAGVEDCVAGTPSSEICNDIDDDCNGATDDGCDDDGDDYCDEAMAIVGSPTACPLGGGDCDDDEPDRWPGNPEVCDGLDNDCAIGVDDGCDDDGDDYCDDAMTVVGPPYPATCPEGGGDCDDGDDAVNPGEAEVCDGADNDCNPATADGAGDAGAGIPCDGADADLCDEGGTTCSGGTLVCSDPDDADPEMCNGANDDCNAATPDGWGDPGVGVLCDGTDADLCNEGTSSCAGAAIVCSDPNDADPDLCNGLDEDCNSLTADGSDDAGVGVACDGTDTDLCLEGATSCSGGAIACSDPNDVDNDLCNGSSDDDCDASSADGSEDPLVDVSCDGADSDLCLEGTSACSGGAITCSDATGSTLDTCNGLNDDCDPASADGSEDPLWGASCDGPDSDLCVEGSYTACTGGSLICSDATSSTLDLCNAIDDDCDSTSANGSEDPLVGISCDGGDTDLCLEGTSACSGGAITCSDTTSSTSDLCNLADDDCDPASADGAEDPLVGPACDGADTDLCLEGVYVCAGGVVTCNDANDVDTETCNSFDDDCDGTIDEGIAEAASEGANSCTGSAVGSATDNPASSYVMSGTVHTSDEDWRQVTVVDDSDVDTGCGDDDEFNLKICWGSNPGNVLRADVYRGSCPPGGPCSGGTCSCTNIDNVAGTDARWEYTGPDACEDDEATSFGGALWVRIYRPGATEGCTSYSLTVANGTAACP